MAPALGPRCELNMEIRKKLLRNVHAQHCLRKTEAPKRHYVHFTDLKCCVTALNVSTALCVFHSSGFQHNAGGTLLDTLCQSGS